MEGINRRQLLQKAGVTAGAAGALWVTPAVNRFISPAAAMSGTISTSLHKGESGSGGSSSPDSYCGVGAGTSVGRGSVKFTRTESPAQLTVAVNLSVGTPITRTLYVLQSDDAGNCLAETIATSTWDSDTNQGTAFTVAIASGATTFVVLLFQSGGKGNDQWSTKPVHLP